MADNPTSPASLEIRMDDVSGREIIDLLREHLGCMAITSPPESRHALDLDGLRKPEVTFWTIWNGSDLAGCGALKELDREHGEVKSMRTVYAYQRKGVAAEVLRHLIREAERRGYRRLSLETGAMEYFRPARNLYARFGFTECDPFPPYKKDPNSVFMTRTLAPDSPG